MNEYFADVRKNPNNFSHWYPVLQEAFSTFFTELQLPKSVVFQLPDEVVKAGFMECPEKDRKIMLDFVKNEVMPKLSLINGCELFIKNGTFSNKFEGHYPNVLKSEKFITDAFLIINYTALCVDAMGFTEMVVRERCPFDKKNTPCIYEGLPFRPEFRIFYDFREHKVLYSVNYWNWNYCHDSICSNATDKIIYETTYPYIHAFYEGNKQKVEEEISTLLQYTKESDIGNRYWSIDVMYDDVATFWVIDMAVAEQSVYWNQNN